MSSARRLTYRTWSSPGTYLTEICATTNPYFPAGTGKPILSNILENLGGESTPWFMLEPVKHARVASWFRNPPRHDGAMGLGRA